jgi:hypothetical protein
MPKVTVRKCPITGKVFFGDDEYAEHIVALRKSRNDARILRRERALIRERVWYALSNISSPKVLAAYINDHFHDIMIAHNGARPCVVEVIREMKMKDFQFERLYFREHCSNSHAAPRDGVTNWSARDHDKPTGYPGFTGRVHYTVTGKPKSGDKRLKIPGSSSTVVIDVTEALKYIGIRTGSGSTSSQTGKAAYDATMFLSDFDAMKKAYFHAKLEDRDFIES